MMDHLSTINYSQPTRPNKGATLGSTQMIESRSLKIVNKELCGQTDDVV